MSKREARVSLSSEKQLELDSSSLVDRIVLANRDIRLFDIQYSILIPMHIPILLKVLKPIQEILVSISIQIMVHNNLQPPNAPPQLVNLVPWPGEEQQYGTEWEPDRFPLLRSPEERYQDIQM